MYRPIFTQCNQPGKSVGVHDIGRVVKAGARHDRPFHIPAKYDDGDDGGVGDDHDGDGGGDDVKDLWTW